MNIEKNKKRKQKHAHSHSLLCLVPLQRNTHLPSPTLGLLSIALASANLHTIYKTSIPTSIPTNPNL